MADGEGWNSCACGAPSGSASGDAASGDGSSDATIGGGDAQSDGPGVGGGAEDATAMTDGITSSDATPTYGIDASIDASPSVDASVSGTDAAFLRDAVAEASDASSDSGDAGEGAQRCNETGVCYCFNLASIGLGGHTGAQAGTGGTDNTEAFISFLNNQSNVGAVQATQVGCGDDVGCTSPAKPTLSAEFLSQYDVLIFQWMANSVYPVTMKGTSYGYTGDPALMGGGYWTFSADELAALTTWVNAGGGVIVLSGYDYCPGNTGCTAGAADEIGPANQILGAVTDISYTATNTFETVETGNAEYCLGDSNPVAGWAQTLGNGMPDPLGENITEVGAFYGRTIVPGPKAIVDCTSGGTIAAVHEDVGKGHVYVYTSDWVTYTSQWNPSPQPAGYCSLDGSPDPAVQFVYQVPQFWYNAISYASQATTCPFTITGTIPH
jgi:hypothetical protein